MSSEKAVMPPVVLLHSAFLKSCRTVFLRFTKKAAASADAAAFFV